MNRAGRHQLNIQAGLKGWGLGMAIALGLSSCAPTPDAAPPEASSTEIDSAVVEAVATDADALKAEPDSPAETSQVSPQNSADPAPGEQFEVEPPRSEVVSADAKAAAETIKSEPLPLQVQSYSSNELLDAGGGGCGMSLWRADGTFREDSILFSGVGEGPQLLIKLNGKFVMLERMSGSGEEFYGQFAQQQFRNLAGDLQVTTDVTLGAEGEIESVAIADGTVIVKQGDRSQEIAVQGDAGC